MEPFLGSIMPMAFNFAPIGWYSCSGQLLSISQNTALFSLLGTYYGGDGQTTFALPDLRGRVVIGQGQGPGLSNYSVGEAAGVESVTLLNSQMPAHSHTIVVNTNGFSSGTSDPKNNYFGGGVISMYDASGDNTGMNPLAFTAAAAGGSQPFSVLNPYVCMSYNIAYEGIFPSRQ